MYWLLPHKSGSSDIIHLVESMVALMMLVNMAFTLAVRSWNKWIRLLSQLSLLSQSTTMLAFRSVWRGNISVMFLDDSRYSDPDGLFDQSEYDEMLVSPGLAAWVMFTFAVMALVANKLRQLQVATRPWRKIVDKNSFDSPRYCGNSQYCGIDNVANSPASNQRNPRVYIVPCSLPSYEEAIAGA